MFTTDKLEEKTNLLIILNPNLIIIMRHQSKSLVLTSFLLFSLMFIQVIGPDSNNIFSSTVNYSIDPSNTIDRVLDSQIDKVLIDKIDFNHNKIADNLENKFGQVEVVVAFDNKNSFDFGLKYLPNFIDVEETSFLVKILTHTNQLEKLSKIPGVANY